MAEYLEVDISISMFGSGQYYRKRICRGMIYCNCYYKVDKEVLFVKGYRKTNGEVKIDVVSCSKKANNDRGNSVMDNDYAQEGESFLLDMSAFANAENLCEKCLKCKYCESHPVECIIPEIEWLDCTLHDKVASVSEKEMIPNCEYSWLPVPFVPKDYEVSFDIKAAIRMIMQKHPSAFVPTQYYTIPPEVFFELLSTMQPNDKVLFGTGGSQRENGSSLPHETLKDYLNDPFPDQSVLCCHVKDLSKDAYDLLTNELSTDDLYYVIVFPSIELACYGDDCSCNVDGFIAYGPEEVLNTIKAGKDGQRED